MSGCIAQACSEACTDPCALTALTDRIDALEKAAKPPEPSGVLAFLDYLVTNAGNLILLAGGILAIFLVIYWFSKGGADKLILKSAELSPTGASFSFEAATTQVDQLMDQMQEYVVEAAASAAETNRFLAKVRANPSQSVGEALDSLISSLPPVAAPIADFAKAPKEPEKPFIQTAFSEKLPRKSYDGLYILWCLPDAEARPFERRVVEAMGNKIDKVVGPKAALTRLAGGVVYDLVITDASIPETDEVGGLDLAYSLISGIPLSWDVTPKPRSQVGPITRLAVLTEPDRLERVSTALANFVAKRASANPREITPHYLVTSDFGDLRRSIRWAQKQKTKPKET